MLDDIQDYNKDIEDLFLQFMFDDPDLFIRCRSIINPEYFEDRINRRAVSFIQQYSDDHNIMPSREQIYAITQKSMSTFGGVVDNRHKEWFLKQFELFCRHKALEIEILKSADLLREKRYGEVMVNIKSAVEIALVSDLGLDYFEDPKGRIERMLDKSFIISTGWADIDKKLYGGVEKGTLNIFCGSSGTGKSLFLQNWALNHVTLGLNVVYLTLELSENLTATRLDAMISGMGTKEVVRRKDDVELKASIFKKRSGGTLRIKYMNSGTTVNDIRAYLKECEIQTGTKIDTLIVDYLDLMHPVSTKIDVSNHFIKDKYVCEELRNLGNDLACVVVTASQLNRDAVDETEFNHAHIAGGISKINTADVVMAIYCTHSMRAQGKYQIQFLKTRTSSGVGQRVDLEYDVESLRIFDTTQEEVETPNEIKNNNILDKLKRKSKIEEPKIEVSQDLQQDILMGADRLKKMLASRKDNKVNGDK